MVFIRFFFRFILGILFVEDRDGFVNDFDLI